MQTYKIGENNELVLNEIKISEKIDYRKQKENHLIFYNAFMEARKLIKFYSRVHSEDMRPVESFPTLSDNFKKIIKEYNNKDFLHFTQNDLFNLIIKKCKQNTDIYDETIKFLVKDSLKQINLNEFEIYLECKELYDFVAILSLYIDEKSRKNFFNSDYSSRNINDYLLGRPNYARYFNYKKNEETKIDKNEILEKNLKEYFDLDNFEFKGNFINKEYNNDIYNLIEKIFYKETDRKEIPNDLIYEIKEYIQKLNSCEDLKLFKNLSNKAIKSKVKAVNLR